MKPPSNDPGLNDDQLHHLLRRAPARIHLPGNFGREVWSRIEARESGGLGACVSWLSQTLFAALARPLPAALTILTFAASGGLLGGLGMAGAELDSEMRYVQSIHPLMQSGEEGMR